MLLYSSIKAGIWNTLDFSNFHLVSYHNKETISDSDRN